MNSETTTMPAQDNNVFPSVVLQDKQVEANLTAQIGEKLTEIAALEEENKRLKEQCDRLLAQLARPQLPITSR